MKGHQIFILLLVAIAFDCCLSLTQEQCARSIEACMTKFHNLYYRGHYIDAQPEIEPAKKCLDAIDCGLHEYVAHWNEELSRVVEEYSAGVLTGKCTYHDAEKCTLIAYRGVEKDHFGYHKRQAFNFGKPCPKEQKQAARKCLADMKPFCLSYKQVGLFKQTKEQIETARCPA